MNHAYLKALAASIVIASLAACGGGDTVAAGTASAGAKFTSTDNIAAVASGLGGAFSALGGNTLKSKNVHLSSKASSARAKATSTTACRSSGSLTETDDTSTVYTPDGTVVFNACRETFTDSGSNYTLTTDGKITDKCTDPAQTASACNAESAALGESGRPLTFASQSTGTVREDFSTQLILTTNTSTSGASDTASLNGTVAATDNLTRNTFSAVFENLVDVYTTTSSGASETINGAFGLSSNLAKCSVGKVRIRTDSALTYNSNDDLVAGRITLTDGSNQSATIQYNSDGSATVTLGGSTRTYSQPEIDAFCG